MDKKLLETIVKKADEQNFTRDLLIFERPILKSLRRHYEHMPYFKNYSLTPRDAEYISVMNHAKDMRTFYEKLYLPKLNRELIYETRNKSEETSKEDGNTD